MPRVSTKKDQPTVPPTVPTATESTPDLVQVKHKVTGKTHIVSKAYYEANKSKLDVVA